MKATVLIRPKPGILDPQGQAVESSLHHLGFDVSAARVGKLVELEINTEDVTDARAQLERMCEQLLANPLIESYEIELQGPGVNGTGERPLIAVPFFPGSNDDRDAVIALERVGADACRVWHDEASLPERTAAVVLPGGFSYGDYLRCGAIARFSPIMRAVTAFANDGGLVLGICNGFQILAEAGLLPGVLRANESLSFVCRDVRMRVVNADTAFTSRCTDDQEITIPVKHGEGCWFADADLLAELDEHGQIVLRYAAGENPNGAVADVAGVRNRAGNVFGLMPHPEHAVDPLLGSTDGALIMGSLVDAVQLSSSALV